MSYELSLCASGLADRLGDLEFPARLGDLESPVLLGDLEFRSDRLGDRELRATSLLVRSAVLSTASRAEQLLLMPACVHDEYSDTA